MERWSGKVAVVTGASSGIGEAIAIKLVESGLKVVGLSRRQEKMQELSKKLTGNLGKLYAIKCDVTKEEEILNAFKWVKENLGTVQILINNAGIAKQTSLMDGSTELWQEVIATNLTAVCICTRETIKAIQGPKGTASELPGHIIHINSVLGHSVSPLVPECNVYSATKFGVTALAETLRIELNNAKSKIKITSISPGLVRTEIGKDYKLNEEYIELLKIAPILDPEDVADAVIYALSTKPHVLVQELTIRPIGEKI